MADHKSYKSFRRWKDVVCGVSGLLLFGAWLKSGEFFGSEGSVWLCLLFGMPVLIQYFGLLHLDSKFENNHHLLEPKTAAPPQTAQLATPTVHDGPEPIATEEVERVRALVSYSRFYLITMAICLVTYSLLWVIYADGQRSYQWENVAWDVGIPSMTLTRSWIYFGLSVFALGIVATLLCLVMWMTRAIIGDYEKAKATRLELLNPLLLKRGAAEAPFLTLTFFLTVFLGVSYLFGFSFAFHDKSRLFNPGPNANLNEPALVMGNLTGAKAVAAEEPSPTPSPTPIATFLFDIGTSVPNSESEAESLKAVAGIEEKSSDDKAIRIVLIGGADLRQIKSVAYQSNYELAEARAQSAKNLILEKLSSSKAAHVLRNLEWTCLARPNEGIRTSEGSHHSKSRDLNAYEGQEDRTVQVFVIEAFEAPTQLVVRNLRANHVKSLRLMDYIYFANYTITTTGYGDIVPNTTYAKFVCSFANICEVLFLVVFFNALLSLGGAVTMSSIAQQVRVLYSHWNIGPPGRGR